MRIVIQKVNNCSVMYEGEEIHSISTGYVMYVGIEKGDSMDVLLRNIETMFLKMRHIFDSKNDILILSQFTLFADLKKNKPNFHHAEVNKVAKEIFFKLVEFMKNKFSNNIQTGIFGEYLHIKYAGKDFNTMLFDFNTDLRTLQ